MSSFCKSHVFSKNITIYAIFNDQSFKDTLTNHIVSFEQLGPVLSGLKNALIMWSYALFVRIYKNYDNVNDNESDRKIYVL